MKKRIFCLAAMTSSFLLIIPFIASCKDAPEGIYRTTIAEKVLYEAEREADIYWFDTDKKEPLSNFIHASPEINRAISKGDEAYSQNRIQAAIQYYREAFDLGLEEIPLLFRIAWLLQKDEPLKAAWFYSVANDIYKDMTNGKDYNYALFNCASCYIMLGKFKDEYYYDEELSKDYRIKDYKLKKRKGALTLLNELLEVDQRYLYAYYNRAHCYYYLGYYQEALDDLKVFLTKGGQDTTFIAPALDMVTLCEEELRIPDSERFMIAAPPKPIED